jgi:hypothetical protein
MYRSHAALTAWFETWLSVPVSSFYCQTTPTCTQIVYALAMLGRWARLVTPSMMAESPASFPDELTVPQEATGPAVDLSGLTADLGISGAAAAAAADAQSVPGISSSAATPSGNSDSSVEKGPCGYNADRYRDMIDPRLPSALLRLQSQLQHAPGLAIDAPSMLSTVYTRFLQASASIQRRSVESENREPNAWTVSALKIIFTRARLEEWADLVSLGANRPGLDEAVGQQPQAGPDVVAHGMAYSMDGGHNNFTMTAYPEEGLTSDAMGCGSGAPWMPDLTQTGDPVMWLDRYMDWAPHHQPPPSAMVNPQLGNMEQ